MIAAQAFQVGRCTAPLDGQNVFIVTFPRIIIGAWGRREVAQGLRPSNAQCQNYRVCEARFKGARNGTDWNPRAGVFVALTVRRFAGYPYSREWGYYPSGGLATLLIVVLILLIIF